MRLPLTWRAVRQGESGVNDNVEQWRVRKAAVSAPGGAVAAQHWLAARAGAAMLADKAFRPQAERHAAGPMRSEEHTSELQSLMRISYAVFCLKKKKKQDNIIRNKITHHKETKSIKITTYTTKATNT